MKNNRYYLLLIDDNYFFFWKKKKRYIYMSHIRLTSRCNFLTVPFEHDGNNCKDQKMVIAVITTILLLLQSNKFTGASGTMEREEEPTASAARSEHENWEKITNRFTNQYGGIEGGAGVLIEATKDQAVPFTLLSLGGMSVSATGTQKYLNDVYTSQNDGFSWSSVPKAIKKNAFHNEIPLPQFTRRWSSASTVLRIYNYNITNQAMERIYNIGGYYIQIGAKRNYNIFLNDIYYTDVSITQPNATMNGLSWYSINATDVCVEIGKSLDTCIFSPRYGHSLIAFGGDFTRTSIDHKRSNINSGAQVSSYLIVIGGRTQVSFKSDVWISKDGG
jgi:hypothetical protein